MTTNGIADVPRQADYFDKYSLVQKAFIEFFPEIFSTGSPAGTGDRVCLQVTARQDRTCRSIRGRFPYARHSWNNPGSGNGIGSVIS